jgi:hypothetical protein
MKQTKQLKQSSCFMMKKYLRCEIYLDSVAPSELSVATLISRSFGAFSRYAFGSTFLKGGFSQKGGSVNPYTCHFSSCTFRSSSVRSFNGECFTTIKASMPQSLQTRQLCITLKYLVSYISLQYTHATKFVSFRTNVSTLSVTHFM